MKKNIGFLILTVIISVLFSCDFQIPSAVEIRGNPEIKIAAQKDIGAAFTDLDQINGSITSQLIEYRRTGTRTYILRETFDDSNMTFPSDSGTFNIPIPGRGLGSNTANVSVDFDGIITGFTLKRAIARVFVDGNPNLLSRLKIDIIVTYDDEGGLRVTEPYDEYKFNEGESKVSGPIYNGSIPGSPKSDIPLPLDADSLQIEFKVSLEPGSYDSDWFTDGLNSEIIVLVPLVFTADSDAAEIVIPVDALFTPGDDLFGRGPGDSFPLDGLVESLELSIVLKKNPFDGRVLKITSTGGIKITHRMRGNAFSFPIDKGNMELLNDPTTVPFVPNFRILFEEGDRLEFPWDLSSTTFVFKAKINKRMEF